MAGKVVAYLAENGTKRFILGHLSKENNFPQLAYQTVSNILREKNIDIEKRYYAFCGVKVRSQQGGRSLMGIV